MSCLHNYISEIVYAQPRDEIPRQIVALLKKDIVDNPIGRILNVDQFPLTVRQFKTITRRFEDNITWDNIMLILKIALYVRVEDKEEVIQHIIDTYGPWICSNGSLSRLIPRSYWARKSGIVPLWQRLFGDDDEQMVD